jgi:hypothetical protein
MILHDCLESNLKSLRYSLIKQVIKRHRAERWQKMEDNAVCLDLQHGLENLAIIDADIPSSSLLARNVESLEWTKVVRDPNLGRIVIATKDIPVGQPLLREAPALFWKSDDWIGFLTKFNALPEEYRRGILDMYHPPLDSPAMARFALVSRDIQHQYQSSMTCELIHKLLAIVITNTHQYYGNPDSEYEEVFRRVDSGKSALFLYASKVAHSCQPNTAYTSKTQDGKLEYKVIRAIHTGDMVTFSYLDKLYETPTFIRREKLHHSKAFLCECNRCMGPDFSRQFSCVTCNKQVTCATDDSGKECWSCTECGRLENVSSTYEKKEMIAKQQVEEIEHQMMMDITRVPTHNAKPLIDNVSRSLSPLHFLTLQAMELYTRLCASHAVQMEQISSTLPHQMSAQVLRKFGSVKHLRMEAAKMGLAIASACECIAAGCNGRDCSTKHAAIYECHQTVFFASQDLLKCDSHSWPDDSARMIQTYIPLMRISFGENDSDVAQIEKVVITATSERIASLESQSSVTTKPKGKKTSGKHNNKKKNRKKK